MSEDAGYFSGAFPGLPEDWRRSVVAIGNFDGIHRGHQAVLQAARNEADRLGCRSVVLTFEPHPRAFFSGRHFFRLTAAPLKSAVARACGIDAVLVLRFDAALAGLGAEEFVDKVLVGQLAIRHVVTGFDFHFGKGRSGTPEFLRSAGSQKGFGVTIVPALADPAGPVSSTRIRDTLAVGDVVAAADLLGWHWAVEGTVARGERRGRELGYPTANMELDPQLPLRHGIYAVRYARPDGTVRDGVASFGRRPTFDDGRPLLETFLFDFTGSLYGETGLVSFVSFIRPELRFESIEALVAAMETDSLEARERLRTLPESATDRRIRGAWCSDQAPAARDPEVLVASVGQTFP